MCSGLQVQPLRRQQLLRQLLSTLQPQPLRVLPTLWYIQCLPVLLALLMPLWLCLPLAPPPPSLLLLPLLLVVL
jgi:hypothetical protein